jgi:nicotinamide riboside transporter PnuC
MTSILIQLAASLSTLLAMWLMGNRTVWGPAIAILSEAFWTVLIFHNHLWGILPLTVALIIIQTRNMIKWSRAAKRG